MLKPLLTFEIYNSLFDSNRTVLLSYHALSTLQYHANTDEFPNLFFSDVTQKTKIHLCSQYHFHLDRPKSLTPGIKYNK